MVVLLAPEICHIPRRRRILLVDDLLNCEYEGYDWPPLPHLEGCRVERGFGPMLKRLLEVLEQLFRPAPRPVPVPVPADRPQRRRPR